MDFATQHAGTAREGGYVMIGGRAYTYTPPRGHAVVHDDNKYYFYRVRKGERREFRQWAASVFSGMNCRKVRGAWPSYRVEG